MSQPIIDFEFHLQQNVAEVMMMMTVWMTMVVMVVMHTHTHTHTKLVASRILLSLRANAKKFNGAEIMQADVADAAAVAS